MPDKDRIFISIGVSRAEDLDELPGAITAARRMAIWADAQGYLTVPVDDGVRDDGERADVTIDLLRKKMATAIAAVTSKTRLQRLVVFFAGHGAALALGDQYWILTYWKSRPTEAIRVASLQRVLEYYGPTQVAMIGDACQEFSSRFIDINGSSILDRPDEEQQAYELDQFFAVDVGKQAFMIKATSGRQDFCLFTEVLLDALEGDAGPISLEEIGGDKVVTSQSLARYLDSNVAREAGKYGVRMSPRHRPGFYTDRIYRTLPPARPLSPAPPSPPPIGGTLAGALAYIGGVARPLPTGTDPTSHPRSVARVELKKPALRPQWRAEDAAIMGAREARRRAFAAEVGSVDVRDHFESGCGICVSGSAVTAVDAIAGRVSRVDGQSDWFRVELGGGGERLAWSDVLVTLANERTYAVCALQDFISVLHVLADGTSVSLFHRPSGASEHQGRMGIDLLAKAHADLLDADGIVQAAAALRDGEHEIVTVGCIAAQFYDAIRDVDSLRSLASFYALRGQSVPLDIVLYGGGTLGDEDGRLYVDIPAVAAGRVHIPGEPRQRFAPGPSPEFVHHPVAGRIPWMRRAWSAVTTANCHASAEEWREDALAAMAHLAPGAFSNVVPEGRQALARLAHASARAAAISISSDVRASGSQEGASCA